MNIHWDNVMILILVILALFLLSHCGQSLTAVVSNIGRIGPNHTVEEKTLGLLSLGLLGATFVAIVRIVSRK